MFKTTGSWLPKQHPPWESYTSQNCMIAPVEHTLCGFLPASNLGLNWSGFFGFPEGGLGHKGDGMREKSAPRSQIPPLTHLPSTPNEYFKEHTSMFPAKFDVLASINETPFPQQKKFLIFDQAGDDARLMYNSLHPRYTPQNKHSFWSHLAEESKPHKKEQVLDEEAGENETVDVGSEMHEDTEEINALLYSDDDNDFDTGYDGESDDEVSTGNSPWANQEHDFDQEVFSFDKSSKRQKALDGGHIQPPFLWATKPNTSREKMDGGYSICAPDEEANTTIGNKRLIKDNIHDTLRVIESIIPGLKSKDPIVILDEAINYLKTLKSNAETMCMEDRDESSCCGSSK